MADHAAVVIAMLYVLCALAASRVMIPQASDLVWMLVRRKDDGYNVYRAMWTVLTAAIVAMMARDAALFIDFAFFDQVWFGPFRECWVGEALAATGMFGALVFVARLYSRTERKAYLAHRSAERLKHGTDA